MTEHNLRQRPSISRSSLYLTKSAGFDCNPATMDAARPLALVEASDGLKRNLTMNVLAKRPTMNESATLTPCSNSCTLRDRLRTTCRRWNVSSQYRPKGARSHPRALMIEPASIDGELAKAGHQYEGLRASNSAAGTWVHERKTGLAAGN